MVEGVKGVLLLWDLPFQELGIPEDPMWFADGIPGGRPEDVRRPDGDVMVDWRMSRSINGRMMSRPIRRQYDVSTLPLGLVHRLSMIETLS